MPRVQSGFSVATESGERRAEPFRGVRPFGRTDADVFAGRRDETSALVSLVAKDDFRAGALIGSAGVGKTSLLCAGLSPRLERVGTLPVYIDSSTDVRLALRKSLFQASATPPKSDEEAVAYAARMAERWPEGVLLLFDDVDEQIVGDGADVFADTLKALLSSGGGKLRMIFAVDSSAFFRLSNLEQRVGAVIPPACRVHIEPLDRKRATQTIEEGVLSSGIYFQSGMSETIARDLTRDGPVLPLDLQLTLSAAIEQRALSARRYARSGGAGVLRAQWLRSRMRDAGQAPALVALSELADRRHTGEGWYAPEDLMAATGLSSDQLRPALESLARDHILAERSEPTEYRLDQRALVPLVRTLDGPLRAKRLRARLTLQNRLHAGGLLRPGELLSARHAAVTTPEERRLLTRSRWVARGLVVLLLAVFLGAGAWVYLQAGSGYHLGLGGTAGAPDRTLVVKRGLPQFARFTPLPHRPRVGAVLVDTGLPAAALKPGAHRQLSTLTGEREARQGRWPRWFAQLLDRLKPTERGQLLLLLGKPKEAWALLAKTATSPAALRRILGVIGIVGRAEGSERDLLDRAARSADGALRRLATHSALAVAARKPKAYPKLLARLAKDKDPAVQKTLMQNLRPLGARRALRLARLARSRQNPTVRRLALSLAVWGATKAPREATLLLAAEASRLARRPASPPRRALEGLLVTHPGPAAKALVEVLATTKAPADQLQLLGWLRRLDKKHLPAPQLASALQPLVASPELAVARLALDLATRGGKAGQLTPLVYKLAEDRRPVAVNRRVLAAEALGRLLQRGVKIDLTKLKRLTTDPAEPVRVAAARAYGAAPASELIVLLRLGGDRSQRVRAAVIESMATLGKPQPLRMIKTLDSSASGGGTVVRVALVTAASHLVRSKRYWSIARNYVVARVRSGNPAVRRAAVTGLGRLAAVRPNEVVKALGRAVTDADRKVRRALVPALARASKHATLKAGMLLVKLVSDRDPQVAVAALRALARLAGQPLLRRPAGLALPAAFKGGDTVCLAALDLLMRLPKEALPPAVDGALAEAYRSAKSQDLRRALLAEAGRVAASETIRLASQSPEPTLRAEALHMAARAGGAKAALVVRSALKDADPVVRRSALQAAARLLDKQSAVLLPVLLDVATDPHDRLRLPATVALGAARGSAKVQRVLQEAARSPRVAVRQTAAQALARAQGGKRLLRRLLRDPALEVRRAAVMAQAARWARSRKAGALANTLQKSPRDRQRRLAAALALHLLRRSGAAQSKAADQALVRLAKSGRPLAALLAGAALLVPPTDEGHQRLLELLDHIFLF